MPENFNPENPGRRKFLKELGKWGAAVFGFSALNKCEGEQDNEISDIMRKEHGHEDLTVKRERSADKETVTGFRHIGVLKSEIERGFEKTADKEKEMLTSEWARISELEETKMYERRFNNSETGLKKYFNDLLSKSLYRKAIGKLVRQYAKEFSAPEEIVLGVIGVESGGDNDAISNSKPEARGILQLLPVAAREMGLRVDEEKDERKEIEKNIKAGIAYLAKMKERFGSWGLALIAFCEGPTKLSSQLRELQAPDEQKTIVHLYSKEFYKLGTTHPFQYPFWVDAIGKQVISIMNSKGLLPIPGRKKEKQRNNEDEEGVARLA